MSENGIGRTRAIQDSLLVLCGTLVLVALVHWVFAVWQRRITVWPIAEDLTLLVAPLLWIWTTGGNLADYGLSPTGIRAQLEAAVRCGMPFSAFALLSFINWGGFAALVSPAAAIAALFLFGCVMRKRSMAVVVTAPCLLIALRPDTLSPAVAEVAFYLLLLGPAEEVLFRGVIQSRLNLGFGRPYEFFGARWGWGAIIGGLLFGLMHVVNLPALLEGFWRPNWWAGPVMFCFALPFAYRRERTGGVIAPALLHAYPQAITYAIRIAIRP